MKSFRVRIELWRGAPADYETLTGAMKQRGFTLQSVDTESGITTYICAAIDTTGHTVHERAAEAAHETGKQFFVFVASFDAGEETS